MKKKRFSESQIFSILKEGETGVPLPDLCRQHGMAQSTYYQWKSRYGGMSMSELKRSKSLEEENRRLKQMYATLSMDHEILKEIIEKKLEIPLDDGN